MSVPTNVMATISPPTCVHGMAWSLPCASCGRGYPAQYLSPWTRQDIDRLLAALERIAGIWPKRAAEPVAPDPEP